MNSLNSLELYFGLSSVTSCAGMRCFAKMLLTIPDPVYKENYSIKGCDQVPEFPEMGVVSLAKTESEKKVVFVDDEHGSEKETAEDGSNDITDKPTPATSSTKRKQKTIKDWLKNPRVYKVI